MAGGGSEPVGQLAVAAGGERWDHLYAALYAPMVRLAGLLVCDYQLGEEIAQDAFARLVEASDSVTDPTAYLRATVANLCRSRIRRAIIARRRKPGSDRGQPGDTVGDVVAASVSVRNALRLLPRRQREAVVLRFYADLSEAEMTSVMGISAGSVKTHLHRAISALSSQLEETE